MKILVTGANGLLGQKLVGLLSSKPAVELIATAKRNLSFPVDHLTFHLLDIGDKETVEQIVLSTIPDVIINCAAMTQVDPCELDHEACRRSNVDGVMHLISAASKVNSHLVHLSTDFVFDGMREMLSEDDIPNPVNYYGKCKLEGEKHIQQSEISWCIIRTVLVYGVTHDMSRSNIVLWVKNSLEAGKTIQVVNDQWRTPTLVEDLAVGCYEACVKKSQGIYHVSGKDYMSVYEIALRTADFFGLDKSLITPAASDSIVQAGRRPPKTGFVIEKARKDLGYDPRSFEEGLAVMKAQIA